MESRCRLLNNPYFYIIGIALVNLLQSYFTELANDEAYYWTFSQQLEWGYFDHPPANPLLIAMGYGLFENELGARLFIVLANTLTFWILYKIVNPKNVKLFFAILFSCVIAHMGFTTAPDIPLLLTVSAFFWVFKYYLEQDDDKLWLLLAIIIAAIGYSKYHGIIALFFAFICNLQLLKRWSFWAMMVLASALLIPHFYWQYVNDFPTFRFHLFDRSPEPYRAGFIIEYILGQLLVFGPFIGFILFRAAFGYDTKDRFEKTMKWCFFGIFGFFLLSSFRGRVEANWTATAMIPLIYLAYHFIENRENLVRWVYRLAIPSLVLIFTFRLILAFDVLPERVSRLSDEFHGWDQWAQDLSAIAGDTAVIFYNNYQRASKYRFYANKTAHAVSTANYGGSQYDWFIEEEEALQGQDVLLVLGVPRDSEGIWLGDVQKVKTYTFNDFYFYNRIVIKVHEPVEQARPGVEIPLKIDIINPTGKTVFFKGNLGKALELRYVVFEYKKEVLKGLAMDKFPLEQLEPGESKSFSVRLKTPEAAGNYRYRFAIFNGIFDEQNANFQKVSIGNQ